MVVHGRILTFFSVLWISIFDGSHMEQPPSVFVFRLLQETMLEIRLQRAQARNEIVFMCGSNDNESFFKLQLADMHGFHRLNPARKVAFFLHGWREEGITEENWQMMKRWTRFAPDYSVCMVDWSLLSGADYKSASKSIFDVGLTVARIIESLELLQPGGFDRRRVTLVGYSLGAHAAGYAGAQLGGNVEQIIGLDPAGPMFSLPAVVAKKYRLDETDARFVQVLHTSGGTLGTNVKSGHADFYPNGGQAPQAHCTLPADPLADGNRSRLACSHSSALKFFKQSMDPEYPFYGTECINFQWFVAGSCSRNRRTRFGIQSTERISGDFYLTTSTRWPFVQRT